MQVEFRRLHDSLEPGEDIGARLVSQLRIRRESSHFGSCLAVAANGGIYAAWEARTLPEGQPWESVSISDIVAGDGPPGSTSEPGVRDR